MMNEKKALLPNRTHDLFFEQTITRWDEAIPLGNGTTGALIWGRAGDLRFSLDRADLWDNTSFGDLENDEFCYSHMVSLARQRNEAELQRIFDAPYQRPLPSKLPAGKLILHLADDEPVCSRLVLAKAEAEINTGQIQLHSFLHATKNIGMIKINVKPEQFSVTLKNPEYHFDASTENDSKKCDSLENNSLKLLHYEKPILYAKEGEYRFVQKISLDFCYGIFVKLRRVGDHTEIAYHAAAGQNAEDLEENALRAVNDALDQGYDIMLQSHSDWWEDYWSKSQISVPEPLFEKQWYLTNYLLASCSRKGGYPMPLQGVWTADNDALPPWKGDYHNDLNTQMSYYHYLKANHLEEGEAFVDYLWSMVDVARVFAKKFYGVSKGICLPGTMSLNGVPLGGWGMYSFSPTNQLWLCQAFERHWRYTGDDTFLREKAYPYLKETADFLLEILEERDGLLYLPVSSSPELHDDTIQAFVTPNSNYDLVLMRWLFTSLCTMSQVLDNGTHDYWEKNLSKLPPLSVTDDGVLKISADEALNESHRHHAHAMAIHPLRLLSYDDPQEKRIIDATILDLERLGTGFWVGFSFPWMAEFYVISKNGNGAAHQLRIFWNHFCSQNGFNLNGDYKHYGSSWFHYRPFTLEANMCAADALQEMLLYSENGKIDLFPAIPDEWKNQKMSFHHLRAEGGVLVSAAMEGGEVSFLELNAAQCGTTQYVRIRQTNLLDRLASKYQWKQQNGYWLASVNAVYH